MNLNTTYTLSYIFIFCFLFTRWRVKNEGISLPATGREPAYGLRGPQPFLNIIYQRLRVQPFLLKCLCGRKYFLGNETHCRFL